MSQRVDLIGRSFGRLRVEGPAGSKRGKSLWSCRCICGASTEVMSSSLLRGLTKSCGCAQHLPKNRFCSVKDCGRKHASKGFCKKHYMGFNARHLRDRFLQKTFGITLLEYEEQLKAQGGVCAICKKPETDSRDGKVKTLSVDHLPGTTHLRALLCRRCNTLLGHVGESSSLLRDLADYLDAHASLRQVA